jgi:hypothetical protein
VIPDQGTARARPDEPHRIALLSDTHIPTEVGRLPESLLDQLQAAHSILHAGDLVSLSVIEQLQRIAPTAGVAGNCDPPDIVRLLPRSQIVELGGYHIGLQHGHQPHRFQSHYIGRGYKDPAFSLFFRRMTARLSEAQIIVFGHFHRPLVQRREGRLFVNPGAVAPTHGRSTFAWLWLEDPVRAEIIDLPLG